VPGVRQRGRPRMASQIDDLSN
jgi:hypothetical protein